MNMRKFKSIYLSLFLILVAMSASVNAQTMGTNINSLLPTQDPYCVTGSKLLEGVDDDAKALLCPRVPASGNITVPSHVVDWILVELRAINHGGTEGSTAAGDADASTLLARKPAFLLSNGRVVDAMLYSEASDQDPSNCTDLDQDNNCPDVEFDNIASTVRVDDVDLYLVIRHSNHLDIISSTHLTEQAGEPGVYAYNFSTGVSTAFGGATGLKDKKGRDGVTTIGYVMYGGDVDGNATIGAGDYATGVAPHIGSGLYNAADADFNGTVGPGDYAGVIAANSGKGSQVP